MRAVLLLLVLGTVAAMGCRRGADPARGDPEARSSAQVRAQRRAYDGAPPVIPHSFYGAKCTACHNKRGLEVPGRGFAPPTPHLPYGGVSAVARCEQCHLYRRASDVFRANGFRGLAQDLRRGRRLHALAPPVIPHQLQMRENCRACHTGPAARREIRTSHPQRARCRQCHLVQVASTVFKR